MHGHENIDVGSQSLPLSVMMACCSWAFFVLLGSSAAGLGAGGWSVGEGAMVVCWMGIAIL